MEAKDDRFDQRKGFHLTGATGAFLERGLAVR